MDAKSTTFVVTSLKARIVIKHNTKEVYAVVNNELAVSVEKNISVLILLNYLHVGAPFDDSCCKLVYDFSIFNKIFHIMVPG